MSNETNTTTLSAEPAIAEQVEENVKKLKLRISRQYGREILELPSMSQILPRILKSDEPEVREVKERERNRILRLRDAEYAEKISEVVDRLNEIITRVRNAIKDKSTASKSVFTGNNRSRNVELQLRMSRDHCPICGNKNVNNVVEIQGQSVCRGVDGEDCGYVFDRSIIHLGTERRVFEGEEDANHSGPAANPLLSDVYNMRTNMVMFTDQGSKTKLNKLKRTQQMIESSVSNLEHEDGRTREDTRERQKARVFSRMEYLSTDMHIHYIAVQRAKEIFAMYRSIRENVHDLDATIHACLVMGYEDVGAHLLAEETGMEEDRKLDELIIHRQQQQEEVAQLASQTAAARAPDPALDTIADIPLGRFTTNQIQDWLLAVSGSIVVPETKKLTKAETESTDGANAHLVTQMIRIIKYLVESKFKESISSGADSHGNNIKPEVIAAQKIKEKRQAEIAELSKGFFGSNMAGRKQFNSAASNKTNNRISTSAASSSTAGTSVSASTVEERVMPGQILLTLPFFDVTRMIRRLQQQLSIASTSSDVREKMDIDEDNEEDEAESLASVSPVRAKIAQTIVQMVMEGLPENTIFLWNEELMSHYESHFRQEVNRRARYDTRKKELDRKKRQEAHRLHVEQQPSSMLISAQLKKASEANAASTGSISSQPNAIPPAVVTNTSSDNSFFDLEDLVGGPITVVRAANTTSSKITGNQPLVETTSNAAQPTVSSTADGAPPAKKPRLKFVVS